MTSKNKTRAGGFGSGLGDNSSGLSRPNYTTIPDPIQQLINQADRRMESDPARYGDHFLIWLSLHALKNGLPWPGGYNGKK